MGEVYQARDTRLHRIVALKLASDRLGDDPQLRARFQREARAVAALNHPHICAIHDVASADGHDFIVMEFLDGETLEQRLRRGPLPLPELFQVAIAIADAMVAAHREGIIHRDLKPSNVMLTRSGPKLLDFGIAKKRDMLRNGSTSAEIDATGTSAATLEGTLVGTAPYMAPEQLEGRPVDVRTDIFCVWFLFRDGNWKARISRNVHGGVGCRHPCRAPTSGGRNSSWLAAHTRSHHLGLPRAQS